MPMMLFWFYKTTELWHQIKNMPSRDVLMRTSFLKPWDFCEGKLFLVAVHSNRSERQLWVLIDRLK
jgi:hypothetical protein